MQSGVNVGTEVFLWNGREVGVTSCKPLRYRRYFKVILVFNVFFMASKMFSQFLIATFFNESDSVLLYTAGLVHIKNVGQFF